MLHRCGPELDSSPGRKKFQPFLREKDGKGEGGGGGGSIFILLYFIYLFLLAFMLIVCLFVGVLRLVCGVQGSRVVATSSGAFI